MSKLSKLPLVTAVHKTIMQERTRLNICHIYSNATRGFFLTFEDKYIRSSYIRVWSTKLDHANPDASELGHEKPKHGLHHRTVMSKQHREHSTTEVNYHSHLILCMMFWKLPLIPFSCKEVPDLVDPLASVILDHWAPHKQ